jgi:hypothetical protein
MIVVTGAAGFASGVTHRDALACTEVGREVEE